MTRQKALFKGQNIEVVDTKRIVKRAEYQAVKDKQPCFGMDKRELFVLHREAGRRKRVAKLQGAVEVKRADDGRGLVGQTVAVAVDAEHVIDGLASISPENIKKWQGMCHYFCISINETHESFWWDIDTLADMVDGCMEGVPVELITASEYHRPLNVPLGWPWGKSPIEKLGIGYLDFPGRVCLTDNTYARPHWTGWGNLHPSGGESEGHYIK
jgi:hypothetical protein